MPLYDLSASKRPVNVTLNSDLLARARIKGLNVSALAEEAVSAALDRIVQKKIKAEIARRARLMIDTLLNMAVLATQFD